MEITLPYHFDHRDYQVEPWDECMKEDFKRGLFVIPRRNGKDLLCWNILIAKAMQKVALYYYMAPFYNQVRQIIWEGFTGSGRRFMDYIPPELIDNKTKLDMRIDLINGSQIKLQGSDQIDRIVGTNPYGIVFTEFSLHKPEAWDYLRPILAENGGWAIFNGTPRGQNHFYHLYNFALANPEWFVQYLTCEDTGVPTKEAIQAEIESGMPETRARQEFYCSWLAGVVGAYFANLIEDARNSGRIGIFPHDPALPVYDVWDLGVGDTNAIWYFQLHGVEVRLVDYYQNSGEGMLHYIKYCKEKPYAYGEHFAPHDIIVRDYSTGTRRIDTAREHNYDFTIISKTAKEELIEGAREILPRCYFHQPTTQDGVDCLMNYKKRWNEKEGVYALRPVHNWASHGADAFQYLGQAVKMIAPGVVKKPNVITHKPGQAAPPYGRERAWGGAPPADEIEMWFGEHSRNVISSVTLHR